MHRFLILPDAVEGDRVFIGQEDAKHMLQVLRHKEGDRCAAFDGTGMQYDLELISVQKNKAIGKIISAYHPETEAKVKVTLYQGIPKIDKMDFIVQKSVELGIAQIVPVFTQYSVPKAQESNMDGRLERWNRISREACKQSGRVVVPEVLRPMDMKMAMDHWSQIEENRCQGSHFAVFSYEKESKKCLKDLFKCYNIDHVNAIGVFIGPEGGFSADELQLAEKYRVNPISLGKRILRTETAALVVLAVIMHEMGEMRI